MKSKEKDLVMKKGVQKQPKKPYRTPQLTVHGSVEKITGRSGGGSGDGMSGSQ
jgi:hypothetical protein